MTKEQLRRIALPLSLLSNSQTVFIWQDAPIEKELHELVKGFRGYIKVFQFVGQHPPRQAAYPKQEE